MSDTILAVIITGVFGLVSAVVAAQIAAKAAMQKAISEMDKRLAVSEVKHQADIALLDQKVSTILVEQQEIKSDVKEHNGYGKIFAESRVEMQNISNEIAEIKQTLNAR